MEMQVKNELMQGGADIRCPPDKLSDQPKHANAGLLPNQVPEMGASAPLGAERKQAADGGHWDDMLCILEQAWIEPGLGNYRSGVQAKFGEQAGYAQDRRDAQRTLLPWGQMARR
jgi:hypothetical protein